MSPRYPSAAPAENFWDGPPDFFAWWSDVVPPRYPSAAPAEIFWDGPSRFFCAGVSGSGARSRLPADPRASAEIFLDGPSRFFARGSEMVLPRCPPRRGLWPRQKFFWMTPPDFLRRGLREWRQVSLCARPFGPAEKLLDGTSGFFASGSEVVVPGQSPRQALWASRKNLR